MCVNHRHRHRILILIVLVTSLVCSIQCTLVQAQHVELSSSSLSSATASSTSAVTPVIKPSSTAQWLPYGGNTNWTTFDISLCVIAVAFFSCAFCFFCYLWRLHRHLQCQHPYGQQEQYVTYDDARYAVKLRYDMNNEPLAIDTRV